MTIVAGPKPRMEIVDSLRGFALMGLFLVHAVELYELYWGKSQPDSLTQAVFTAFMGKSFSMLALCFGFSFFVIMDRAKGRGQAFEGRFAWRMILIVALGYIHGLLYRGDILMVLGAAGLFMLLIDRIKSIKTLWLLATLFLVQPILLVQLFFAANGAEWANTPPHYWNDPSMPIYMNGTFFEVIKANVFEGQMFKWWFMLESGRFVQLLGLFTIGLILGRVGFFERPESFMRSRFVAFIVIAAVFLGVIYFKPWLEALLPEAGMSRGILGGLLDGLKDISQMGLYVLIFMSLYLGLAKPLLNLLAASGRMTLTLYIVQSVLFVPVFYGFGLRGFETFQPWQSLSIGIGFSLFQIWFANQWFKSFYYGPIEWLWRALTLTTADIPFRKKSLS